MDTAARPSAASSLRSAFISAFKGRSSDRNALWCAIIVFAVTFLRPQEVIPALAPLKIAITLQVLGTLVWLTAARRSVHIIIVLLSIFLGVEMLRLLVGRFFNVSAILVNHFWQFQMLRDLGLQFTSLVFPLAVFAASGIGVRRVMAAMGIVGSLLIAWIITHSGTGPGGFISDENDAAFCLLFFLGPLLAIAVESRVSFFQRLVVGGAALATIVGITFTLSRGGFVGMVAALAYLFLYSRRKAAFIVIGVIMLFGVAVLAPSKYVAEIETISTEDSTADLRFFYWSLAWRVWKDHPLTGVGLGSAMFILGDYQTQEEFLRYPKASGRAVHSLYFQMLSDVGLIGICLLGLPLFLTFKNNSRLRNKIYRTARQLEKSIYFGRRDTSNAGPEMSTEAALLTRRLLKELDYLRVLALGLNVSFAGCLVSGAFVSVMLYPPLWVLCGLSIALQTYAYRLLSIAADGHVGRVTDSQPEIPNGPPLPPSRDPQGAFPTEFEKGDYEPR